MKKANSQSVAFSCHSPKAEPVFVEGTSNDRKPDAAPLHTHAPRYRSQRATTNKNALLMGNSAANWTASTSIVAAQMLNTNGPRREGRGKP